MILLGLDLETTGLDIDIDRIIEVGLVLWDTEMADGGAPVRLWSEFIDEPNRPALGDHLTHITDEILATWGYNPEEKFQITPMMLGFFEKADYIVAHNGTKFDKPMFIEFLKRHNHELPEKPWIDTLTDIEYPEGVRSLNMLYLGAFHGFVNPFPHRAVTDVLAMFKIMSRYDLDRIIEVAASPTRVVQALVDFDHKQLAKDNYFNWNTESKIWFKEIKEIHIEDAVANLPFEVKVLH